MMGLLYFLFFAFYLLISIVVIIVAYRYTKERYQRGWVGGWLAAFVMYNLVFWDWIPVLVIHENLCAKQGGFWVNKSAEQWVREHPTVVGEDWSDQSKWRYETIDGRYEHSVIRSWISSLIFRDLIQTEGVAHAISKSEERIVDAATGQVLAQSVDFHRGSSYQVWAGEYKVWLREPISSCGLEIREGVSRELFDLIKVVKGGTQ